MPFPGKLAEALVGKHLHRLSIVDLGGKPQQLFFRAPGFLLVNRPGFLPSIDVFEQLIQETTQILGFFGRAHEDERH